MTRRSSGIVADASKYVAGYASGPRGESQVVFDGPAVQQAITAAGRSTWDASDPSRWWCSIPRAPGAQADAARTELERVAAERGLPISLVPMATTDAAANPSRASS